ncbi:MAG: hypothetical protein ACJ8GN_31365 [Longimicrobiaceae bacterium]
MRSALLPDTRDAAASPAPAAPRTAPAALRLPTPVSGFRAGQGEIHAHHGEIVQGMFYTSDETVEHGLVTLPCTLYRTRVRFRPLRSGPLTVEPGDRSRA